MKLLLRVVLILRVGRLQVSSRDLLQTIQGAALVNDLLSRIYFGVYT